LTINPDNNYKVVVMALNLSLGEFEQLILLAVLRLGDDAYGVSIRSEILACTRREVSPGALYTTLDRLECKGMITSTAGAPTPERGGRSKRFYKATPSGTQQLATAQRAFQKMLNGLELLGEQYE
jgi:DNA-binding PadR family transcriptional regulator